MLQTFELFETGSRLCVMFFRIVGVVEERQWAAGTPEEQAWPEGAEALEAGVAQQGVVVVGEEQ